MPRSDGEHREEATKTVQAGGREGRIESGVICDGRIAAKAKGKVDKMA